MNVKTTVTLPEHVMRYAEKMVAEGLFPSIDSVLAASLEEMMENGPPRAVKAGIALPPDELRRRMALPDDQWISMDEDDLFDRVRARIAARPAR